MQTKQPDNQKNLLAAIILSVGVLLLWQVFYAGPKMQEEQARLRQAAAEAKQSAPGPNGSVPQPTTTTGGPIPTAPGATATGTGAVGSRDDALKLSPRVAIDTPRLTGSIALQGGRIDDLVLRTYRDTVDPKSPNVVLFSPAQAPAPYFAEYGWVPQAGSATKVPGRDTIWTASGPTTLTPSTPVVLSWDNGAGLVFRRTIAVDPNYMFTVKDEVENKSGADVQLFPYARVFREGTPKIEGFFIQHEGLIGVIGEKGLQEHTYSNVLDDGGNQRFDKFSGGWLGFTDKYWAATLVPDQTKTYSANMAAVTKRSATVREAFQADYIAAEPTVVAPGATGGTEARLFAGAKQVNLIESYAQFGILKFDLLVDWGWFYFITKPLYHLIDFLYHVFGNFGVAILLVTVIVKALFFPLANKSYASMAKMKKLQPEMEKLRERFKDDKARQSQELMALYQKEKINPLAGCLPILLQIPVFFALYKVLFISIDMRHAPFFGWIRDLSAPDPTSVFNLMGLLPIPPVEAFLLGHTVGLWAVFMGITMWLQMQLNPQQPDPMQQAIFNWMPLLFMFMLSGFASGLVIYWAWNNTLSIAQQYVIMKRLGVDVPLVDNVRKTLAPIGRFVGLGRGGGKA